MVLKSNFGMILGSVTRSMRMFQLPNLRTNLCCVSDLVQSNNAWNATLINSTFSATEAHIILNMPRDISLVVDEMIWDLSRSGTYSVKSTYYHATKNLVE